MKIQHLRFFAAVIDCGGVMKAAERLHVSQPAVSAGLKALEQELGQPLFDRSAGGRHLVPTPKALIFHRHARDILRRCETARAAFRSAENRPPRLRIGVLETVAAADAAAAAAWFGRHDGRWRWQMWEGPPHRLAQWLRQGRIDAAWTLVEPGLENAQLLWREPFVALAARTHRLAQSARPTIALEDLDGEPLVLRASCELKEGRLRAAGIIPRIAARAERDDLALRLVAQGVGIAIAPLSLATGDVVALEVAGLGLFRSIGLKWRPGLPDDTVAAVLQGLSSLGPKAQARGTAG